MITLIREEPTETSAPFWANQKEDGLFERMDGSKTAEQAAVDYALGAGARAGSSVWIAWGEVENPLYDARYPTDAENFRLTFRCVREFVVVRNVAIRSNAKRRMRRREREVVVREADRYDPE